LLTVNRVYNVNSIIHIKDQPSTY